MLVKMNEEAQTVITTESNLKDPHRFLPDELFCHFLSFLLPSQIAITSAVSRNWRVSNLADPTLYSVIDLSQPGWLNRKFNKDQSDDKKLEEEMQLYLFHFERLSSLASNRVKEVSINLACFLSDFEEGDIEEDTRLDELLSILILSSATLEEVSINLDFGEMLKYVEPEGPPPLGRFLFVQTVLQHLTDHYPNLRKIELSAPICISFQAGVDQQGFKKISICDGNNEFFSNKGDFPNADTICSLIKSARDFAGTGLTEFHLDTDDEEMVLEWYDEIISELWNSRSTLQHLGLDESALNSRKAWELVMSCRNLLTKGYYSSSEYQSGINLEVEAGEEVSLQEVAELGSFKNVSIFSESGWRSIVKWIGNGRGLEFLDLNGERISEEEEEEEVAEDLSSSGLSLGHILRNAQDTLEHLHLSSNALGHLSFLPSTLPFPKLRDLRLVNCSLQLWSAISKLQSLQLCSLDVWLDGNHYTEEEYGARQQAQAFDCLISILKRHPTLISVEFIVWRDSGFSSLALQKHLDLHHETSQLSFKLKSLQIRSPAASKWFSQHHYPKLKELNVNDKYQSHFKNIPIELQVK